MHPPITVRHPASPALRDRFLDALDRGDVAAIAETARNLTDCTDALPTMTCNALGLAPRSTYGDAAQKVSGEQSPRPAGAV